MARISTYGIDASPDLTDKVIGTNTGAGAGNSTKNYKLSEVSDLINNTNSLAIADQVIFSFQWDLTEGRNIGTISFEAGAGRDTAFNAITSVIISKSGAGGKSMDSFLPLFATKEIILADSADINNFGTFRVTSIEEYTEDSNFFKVDLTNLASNGVIQEDKYYIFSEFLSTNGDKHFTFTQPTPSEDWVIQHNMDKFPTVSVVNNNNVLMYGETTYIDKNNLTINFSAGFSGKAYLN